MQFSPLAFYKRFGFKTLDLGIIRTVRSIAFFHRFVDFTRFLIICNVVLSQIVLENVSPDIEPLDDDQYQKTHNEVSKAYEATNPYRLGEMGDKLFEYSAQIIQLLRANDIQMVRKCFLCSVAFFFLHRMYLVIKRHYECDAFVCQTSVVNQIRQKATDGTCEQHRWTRQTLGSNCGRCSCIDDGANHIRLPSHYEICETIRNTWSVGWIQLLSFDAHRSSSFCESWIWFYFCLI